MAKIVEDLTKLYGSFDWDDHEVRQRPKKSLSRKDKNKARQKRLMAATRLRKLLPHSREQIKRVMLQHLLTDELNWFCSVICVT